MNDEELIAELRQTLHARAESISPSGTTEPEAPFTPLRPPARRRRLIYASAVGVAAAAAAATVLAVTLSSPSRQAISFTNLPTQTVPHGPPRTTIPSPTSLTTAVEAPATTVAPSPSVAAGPATVSPTRQAPAPVPSGFQPLSATFVSARTGWVLGLYPCTSGQCAAIAETTDGGLFWTDFPAPPITFASPPDSLSTRVLIRFANLSDGWVVVPTPGGADCCGGQLWSTHDGGGTWSQVTSLTSASAGIASLEISNGVAWAVTLGPPFRLYDTSVGSDSWMASDITLAVGGGPVPDAQLVLTGQSGWILDTDRTIVAGASLGSNGQWAAWIPPCLNDNGPAVLAAASASDVAAVCEEGVWGAPGRVHATTGSLPFYELYLSSDSGSTFKPAGTIPTADAGLVAASPAGVATTVVTGGNGILSATFNGGQSWQTVSSGQQGTATFLGFTTGTQGVAVFTKDQGGVASSTLLITRDGGQTWDQVTF